MGEAATCEHCGAKVAAGTYFCGGCGKAVKGAAQSIPARKQTMFGVPPELLPARPDTPEPPAPSADTRSARPGAGSRTVLGMPSPLPPAPAEPMAEATAEPISWTHPDIDGGNARTGRPGSARIVTTRLGLPSSVPPAAAAEPVNTLGSTQTIPPDPPLQRTLASGSDVSTRGSSLSVPGQRRSSSRPFTASQAEDMVTLPPRKSAPALVLAALSLVLAGALGYWALRGGGPEVRVRIETQPDGEWMLFEVEGAPKGARLRFGGQEKPLEAGRARFALAADSLRVGKNAVLFDVISPSGSVDSARVALAVDYRVTLDTAPLRAGKPQVDVVVAAAPGSRVWLDGEELKLDAQGRAMRSDPLDSKAMSGQIIHVVRYRVQPPSGEASVGELRTLIPMTVLQIDRPGPLLTTDKDAVEIAGMVDKDARVTIDGTEVALTSGRFLHSFPLPAAGEYQPKVIATAPGKAPHISVLTLRRVHDMTVAAEGFNPDPGLSYAKVAQNPAIYRGQRVDMQGRVYNVKVEGGKSALQVLVRECPAGERCPLWVSYGAATDFTVNSWVRVLGLLDGEQQFRSETDEVKSVPKVEAVFLLPATAP